VTQQPYEPTDRRPIASRERPFWQKVAAGLAARRVSPNLISVLGMIAGLLSGAALALSSQLEPHQRALLLAGALLAQLRLIANMLDGMVAVAAGVASRMGELYNEFPDRVSDVAILVGAGYAVGGHVAAGFTAACLAVTTAYIRAVGKTVGAKNLFVGPMAKAHRMAVIIAVAFFLAVTPDVWHPVFHGLGLLSAALLVVIAGSIITCLRRVTIIVKHLKENA